MCWSQSGHSAASAPSLPPFPGGLTRIAGLRFLAPEGTRCRRESVAGAPTTFMVTGLARAYLLGLPVRGRRATPPAGKQLLMSSGFLPGFSALPWLVRHSWNKHSWKWPTLSVPIPNPLALTFPMHRSQRPAPSTCHST